MQRVTVPVPGLGGILLDYIQEVLCSSGLERSLVWANPLQHWGDITRLTVPLRRNGIGLIPRQPVRPKGRATAFRQLAEAPQLHPRATQPVPELLL